MISTKLENKPTCPQCKATLDGASHADSTPEPGDLTICVYCTALLQFSDSMTLVGMDIDDISPADRESIYSAIEMVKKINQSLKIKSSVH